MTRQDPHRHYLSPWATQGTAPAGPSFDRGEGAYLIGSDGARVFDFSSGWIAANLGHSNDVMADAVADQMRRLCFAPPSFPLALRSELARRLSDLSPWNEGARVHFTTGGGEANDDAVKAARLLTGRTKVMAAYRSYHGTTGTAAGLTGDMRRWASEPTTFPAVRFFAPYPYRSPFHTDDPVAETARAMDHLSRIVTQEGAHNIAALVIEPMVGSSGVIVYPEGYLAALRQFTSRHGILLIFDEVMTGFGRTGAAFAAERFGVAPDMITFAKGVNGAAIPLGGVMIRESVAAGFDQRVFDIGHTNAGHPVAMASGLAALDLYESGNLFARAREIERLMAERLDALQQKHALIGDVRGVGAFWGIELVGDRASKAPLIEWYAADPSLNYALVNEMLRRGLWVYARYGILMLAPPLIATDDDLNDAFDRLDGALAWLAENLEDKK